MSRAARVALLVTSAAFVVAIIVTSLGGSPSGTGSPSAGGTGACIASGPRAVTVPNVKGVTLAVAHETVRHVGLRVVGAGVASGDPAVGSAVVQAQEPSAGEHVPRGACIGFRTVATPTSIQCPLPGAPAPTITSPSTLPNGAPIPTGPGVRTATIGVCVVAGR